MWCFWLVVDIVRFFWFNIVFSVLVVFFSMVNILGLEEGIGKKVEGKDKIKSFLGV